MVGSCIEKMEIPFDAPRWNCKFLKRKKKENWSAHSRFFYGGSNSKPGKHWESTSKNFSLPDVLFRFDGHANQTIKMILEIFRVFGRRISVEWVDVFAFLFN